MTWLNLKKITGTFIILAIILVQFWIPFQLSTTHAEESEVIDDSGEEASMESSVMENNTSDEIVPDDVPAVDEENVIEETIPEDFDEVPTEELITESTEELVEESLQEAEETDNATNTDQFINDDTASSTYATTTDIIEFESNFTSATTTSTTTIETDFGTSTASTTIKETSATTTGEQADKLGTSTSTPTIISGEAVAMANILNILNSNMVNSDGLVFLSNFFLDQSGTIDLRDPSQSSFGCALQTTCKNVDGVEVRLVNDAFIDNAILITATSGDNRIEGGGDASIRTGNAYAGLNLVNLANTNFIDSNYLLVSLNAFKNVSGNIVFPALSKFFNPNGAIPMDADISNSAEVNNNLNLLANSGNNHTDTSSSTISTGNAGNVSNVYNNINTTLFGGDNLHILLRVHGDWVGDVFGAPFDIERYERDSSIYITNGTSTSSSFGSINATNTARINNDITLSAITGNNEITGASTALITTGNAYAGANLINIANANVVGKNWILAIINIFGDFNGNVSFGMPDLWVGEQVSAPPYIENGSEVEYKFTIINKGDLEATNVRLVDNYDASHLEILGSSFEYTNEQPGTMVWEIGNLPEGGATEITYRAKIQNAPPRTEINNTVNVRAREPDNNTDDNTDSVTISTSKPRVSGSTRRTQTYEELSEDFGPPGASLDFIKLNRQVQAMTVTGVGATSTQQLVIFNTSDLPVRSLVVNDILRDPAGNIVGNEVWEIGDLLPNEEITLEYDIQFGRLAKSGFYTLSTVLHGRNDMVKSFDANGFINFILLEQPTIVEEIVSTDTPSVITVSTSTDLLEPENAEASSTPLIGNLTIKPSNLAAASSLDIWSVLHNYWLLLTAVSGTLFSLGLRGLRWVA